MTSHWPAYVSLFSQCVYLYYYLLLYNEWTPFLITYIILLTGKSSQVNHREIHTFYYLNSVISLFVGFALPTIFFLVSDKSTIANIIIPLYLSISDVKIQLYHFGCNGSDSFEPVAGGVIFTVNIYDFWNICPAKHIVRKWIFVCTAQNALKNFKGGDLSFK